MANNYLLFSTEIVFKTLEERDLFRKYIDYFDLRAADEYKDEGEEDEDAGEIEDVELFPEEVALIEDICSDYYVDWEFGYVPDPNGMNGENLPAAWLMSQEGNSVEPVAAIIHLFLKRTNSNKEHVLQWACTCSKPRPDQFHGGTCLITAKDIYWMSPQDQVSYLRDVRERAERKD